MKTRKIIRRMANNVGSGVVVVLPDRTTLRGIITHADVNHEPIEVAPGQFAQGPMAGTITIEIQP